MIKKLLQTRNPGKTSLTHVKDASGFWYVHDGSDARAVVVKQDGTRLEHLLYPDARKGKDYAVSILKLRTAGILKHEDDAPVVDSSPVQKAQPDPKALKQQLEQMRAPAVNAAASAAASAQARHEAQKQQQELAAKAKSILKSVPALDSLDELDAVDGEGDDDLDPGLLVDDELGTGLGLSADDAAHAKEQADKDVAEAEELGKILFATELPEITEGLVTAANPQGKGVEELWVALSDKERAAFRWRAQNETADSKQVPTATAPLRQ